MIIKAPILKFWKEIFIKIFFRKIFYLFIFFEQGTKPSVSQQTNLGSGNILGTLVFGSQNVPRTFP